MSGGAVTSFVMGGPNPHTTTTTAITIKGSEPPDAGFLVPGWLSLISLTEKTVGRRVASGFNSKPLQRHHRKQAFPEFA